MKDKALIWAWVIKNSIVIVSWIALAIIFNKWWIALFAALFMSGLKTKRSFYRVCDNCGKHGPYADSYSEAFNRARKAGWLHYTAANTDYCPDCRKNDEANEVDCQ